MSSQRLCPWSVATEEAECSCCSSQCPRVVSLFFVVDAVEQVHVPRRFTIPCIEEVRSWSSLNLNIVVHVQVKFADLKFTVIARYKQTRKHTHVLCNEVMLVCGSLRLAPISYAVCAGVMCFHYSCHGWLGVFIHWTGVDWTGLDGTGLDSPKNL